jgi:hypothetical protein
VDCINNNDDISQEDTRVSSDTSTNEIPEHVVSNNGPMLVKPPKLQKGVLRTNCIDCLDRTNVAQYAYGLASLGHQLHALGAVESPEHDLDSPLAHHLMHFYERMGDTLALQYGGSAAHNKVLLHLSVIFLFFWYHFFLLWHTGILFQYSVLSPCSSFTPIIEKLLIKMAVLILH